MVVEWSKFCDIATLCQLLKEAYNMNVDEQTHKVILEKKPSDV